MLRLLMAATLGIWGSAAFASSFQSTRIQCTSQNALLDLVPMTVSFTSPDGHAIDIETPFNVWIASDAHAAAEIEKHRKADDNSHVVTTREPKIQWTVVEGTPVQLNLTRTLKGEEYSETDSKNVMTVSTKEKQFLAGFDGWMFSCAVVPQ